MMKKKDLNKIIKNIGLVLIALSFMSLLATAQTTTISIGNATVSPGNSTILPIMINNVTNVGAANINLSYNPTIVIVTKVINGAFDFTESTINNVTGITNIGGFQLFSAGLNGNVKLAEFTLQAVGSAGSSSPLNIVINSLQTKEANPQPIPATPVNGTFTISDPNPPSVVNPIANPHIISNDGIMNSRLNVTVTDESSVKSVLVDLSSIGGSSTQTMNPVGNNVWSTITNTTTLGVHNLLVNATDIFGNSNTTESIELVVVEPVIIAIGDTTVAPNDSILLPIMINGVSNNASVGAVTVDLRYNKSVVKVVKVANGDFDSTDNITRNDLGITRIYALQLISSGLSGDVILANVTLHGIGVEGDQSPLNLKINLIKTKSQDAIPAKVNNGSILIQTDIKPPVVTNPNATPSAIPDDTDNDPRWGETTQLNITVTDDSGVASVVIDLSAIGGSATQVMTNLPGTDIYTVTTNVSNGTLPRIYNLTVNATDTLGNSNTSGSIQLEVIKNGDVDGDGVVTLDDAIYLAKWVFKFPGFETINEYVADVDGDGVVTLDDAIYLAKWVFKFPGFDILK